MCHHLDKNILPVFYLDKEYVLSMSYFESSWANSVESWFHGLCARRWEPLTATENIAQISTWTRLCQRTIRLISAPWCPLSTVYTAHLRGPCQQLRESLIEYVSAIFSEELSTPALYQPSLGQGTKHKQALREAYHNASRWNSKWQE